MANKNTLDNSTGREIKEMINVEKIAIEQLDASALRKLMNYEIDMLCFGEGDMALIDKCSDLLDKIDPNSMSTDEFMSIIKKNEKEHIIIEDDASYKNVPKKRFVLKRIAIVAAAVMVLMASTVAVAAAFGVNVFEYIGNVARQADGTSIDVDSFTFYKNDETKRYSSIEQLLDEEELDILYPTKFPEGIKIDSIRFNVEADGKETVRFFTNDTYTNIKIILSSVHKIGVKTESVERDGKTYYIQRGNQITVVFLVDDNTYYIGAKTVDDAFLIIENMKE